jgi:hypothetical protein
MVSAQRYTRACPSPPVSAGRVTRSGAPHEMAGEWPKLGAVRSRTSCPCGLLGPAATESGTCPSSAQLGVIATLEGAPTMPAIEAIAFAASAGFAVVLVATTLIATRVASGDAI